MSNIDPQNQNLASINSWGLGSGNQSYASIDTATLSPKGQPTLRVGGVSNPQYPGSGIGEVDLNYPPNWVANSIKPGDHIVWKCQAKTAQGNNNGYSGARVGIDLLAQDSKGWHIVDSLPYGYSGVYPNGYSTDPNKTPIPNFLLPYGNPNWTQIGWDFIVPSNTYTTDINGNPIDGPLQISGFAAWVDTPDPAGNNPFPYVWFGDPYLILNPTPTPPPTGYSIVQSAQGNVGSGSQIPVTLPAAPTVGNVLIACIGVSSSPGDYSVNNIKQQGVTWIKIPNADVDDQPNGVVSEMWIGTYTTAPGPNITITLNGSLSPGAASAIIFEEKGVDPSNPIGSASNQPFVNTGKPTSTGSVTASANQLVVGMVVTHSVADQQSPLNGFSQLGGNAYYGGGQWYCAVAALSAVANSAGVYSSGTQFSDGSSHDYWGCIATFNPAPTPPTTHNLTIQAGTGGTTTPAPGTYPETAGATVTVTAAPTSGNKISDWLLDGVSQGTTAISIPVTMNADHTVQPVFTAIPLVTYNLTVQAATGGTTNPAPGTYTEPAGQNVTVTATPTSGNQVSDWLFDGVSQGVTTASVVIVMNANHTVQPVFTAIPPNTYSLTVQAATAGGTTNPAPGTYTEPAGQNVTVTAIPPTGNQVSDWLLDGVSQGITATAIAVTMNANHTVQPVLTAIPPNTYNLTVQSASGGTTNPAPGTYPEPAGQTTTVTATPTLSWKVTGWNVDGALSNVTTPQIVILMNANHTVQPIFTAVTPSVNFTLTFYTSPINGVPATADGTSINSPATLSLAPGNHTIIVPTSVTDGVKTYDFVAWEDGTTNPQRQINLTASTAIQATYTVSTKKLSLFQGPTGILYA